MGYNKAAWNILAGIENGEVVMTEEQLKESFKPIPANKYRSSTRDAVFMWCKDHKIKVTRDENNVYTFSKR